jgi:hypothetical protein
MGVHRRFRLAPVRVTYANVMATIAVFLALGGGAYAGMSGSTTTGPVPAVRVTNSKAETVHAFHARPVKFDEEQYDNDHLHNATKHNTRLVAPVSGVYDITGNVSWAANASRDRNLSIERNGIASDTLAETSVAVNSNQDPTNEMVETQARLHKGDYVELWVYQKSGSDITLASGVEGPWFAMHYLGP